MNKQEIFKSQRRSAVGPHPKFIAHGLTHLLTDEKIFYPRKSALSAAYSQIATSVDCDIISVRLMCLNKKKELIQ